jgi:mono/diheme cytochrome c family protein
VFGVVIAAIAVLSVAGAGWTQDKGTKTKTVAISSTNSTSGKEMYGAYCAACHGNDGKGNGPAASAFKIPPTDLTLLAKNNNGKFPGEHFNSILKFGTPIAAHGNVEMPVWYNLFRSMDSSATGDGITMMRMKNLRDYVEGLQAK